MKSSIKPRKKNAAFLCAEPRVHGIVQAVLLLLLEERRDHGYELVRRLAAEVPEEMMPDPAVVYRMLRDLERDGAVRSELRPGAGGPARKVYALAPAGKAELAAWKATAERRIHTLERFLRRYAELAGRHGEPKIDEPSEGR